MKHLLITLYYKNLIECFFLVLELRFHFDIRLILYLFDYKYLCLEPMFFILRLNWYLYLSCYFNYHCQKFFLGMLYSQFDCWVMKSYEPPQVIVNSILPLLHCLVYLWYLESQFLWWRYQMQIYFFFFREHYKFPMCLYQLIVIYESPYFIHLKLFQFS